MYIWAVISQCQLPAFLNQFELVCGPISSQTSQEEIESTKAKEQLKSSCLLMYILWTKDAKEKKRQNSDHVSEMMSRIRAIYKTTI